MSKKTIIILSTVLLIYGCNSEKEKKIDKVELALDSVALVHDATKLNVGPRDFSYKLQDELNGKAVAVRMFIRDVIRENDRTCILIGLKSNMILKLRATDLELRELDRNNAKVFLESIVNF